MKKLCLDKNFLIISSISILVVMGVASVIPVFPMMTKALGTGGTHVGLVITAFTIPGVLLSPLAGILADRLGRKLLLVPALLLFGIAGACCAAAPDFESLLVLRLVQGVGMAPLVIVSATLIGDLYDGEDLATAMGAYAGFQTVGLALFPAIGGALGVLGWRAPFLLPVVAVPLALIVWWGLDCPPVRPQKPFGSYLQGAFRALRAGRMVAYFAITLVIFILVFGPMLVYLPLLLGHNFGVPSTTIGLVLSYSAIYGALISFGLGRLEKVLPLTRMVVISLLFYAGALGMIPLITSFWFILIPATLLGLAQGLSLPTMITLVTRSAPEEYRAIFNATYGSTMRLGQAVGPGLMGAVHVWVGIGGVFYAGAALAAVFFALTAALFWHDAASAKVVNSGSTATRPAIVR